MYSQLLDSNNKKIVTRINRYGGLQMILGAVCLILSATSLGIDDDLLPINKTVIHAGNLNVPIIERTVDTKCILIGLDAAAVVCSFFIIFTGFLPFECCTSAVAPRTIKWKKMKVRFMLTNIIAAVVCVPIFVGTAITTYFLRGETDAKYQALPLTLGSVSAVEFLAAILASAFCCCNRWRGPEDEERRQEKEKRRTERKEQRELNKKEKEEKKEMEKKEKEENKGKKNKDKKENEEKMGKEERKERKREEKEKKKGEKKEKKKMKNKKGKGNYEKNCKLLKCEMKVDTGNGDLKKDFTDAGPSGTAAVVVHPPSYQESEDLKNLFNSNSNTHNF